MDLIPFLGFIILIARTALVLAISAAMAGAASAADIRVGPTQTYKTLAAGVAAATTGDRVLLDAGTYYDDNVTIAKAISIEGVGAGAVLKTTQPISNHKGILVVRANLTIKNIIFDSAKVTAADGNNGAGIRLENGDLLVDSCTFVNNQNGMLVNPNAAATVTVANSTFTGNGVGDGYTHAIYVNEVAQLTVRNSTFAGTKVGHDIKSRALRTSVTDSVLDDGVSGTPSYAIDLPNGGVVLLDKVQITQGAATRNPAMIAYGAEGNLKASNSLSVSNSSFINQLQSVSAVGVNNFTTVTATLTGNTSQSLPALLKGPGTVTAGTTPTADPTPTPTAPTPTPTPTPTAPTPAPTPTGTPIATTSTAPSVAPSSFGPPLRQGGVYSTQQTATQSLLRFYNTSTAPGAARVSLYDAATGNLIANYQTPTIAPDGAVQVPVSAIESAGSTGLPKPASYIAYVQSSFGGTMQHLLYRTSDGVLSNATMCDTGITNNATRLSHVHSTLVSSAPSRIGILNTGSATTVTIGIYDARDGRRLGGYVSPWILAGGQISVATAALEAGAYITPPSGAVLYTLKVESGFSGNLQHFVYNQAAALTGDLTALCTLRGP